MHDVVATEQGKVEHFARLFHEALRGYVADHTRDRVPGRILADAGINPLANRALARPEVLRKCLAHDDPSRSPFVVRSIERLAHHERNTHGGEVPIGHAPDLRHRWHFVGGDLHTFSDDVRDIPTSR